MQAIDFHVLSQHCNEALQNFPILLRKQGFKILDLREADLVSDADGSKVEEVYIWCCRGSAKDLLEFKKLGNYDEITYEGKNTLI